MKKSKKSKTAAAPQPGEPTVGRMGQAYEKATGNALERLVRTGRLSPDGADWVVQAIDPFHDYKRNMAGFPDMTQAATVVTCYKYTAQVSPGGGGALWDCHLFALPRCEANTRAASGTFSAGVGHYVTQAAFTTTPTLGFLNIMSMDSAAGGPLFPTSAVWNPAGLVTAALPAAGNTDLSSGYSRVIAAGFEVHNTTAEMYKNGRVTVYSMPQEQGLDHHRVSDVTAGNLVEGTATFKKYRSPPSTAADAMKLAGSMQWDARDGVYMPIPIAGVHNRLVNKNNSPQCYTADPDVPSWGVVDRAVGAAANIAPSYYSNKSASIGTVGAIFEGLSAQTTLTVTLKVYVERAPAIGDAALMPLATPSASYDLHALQLYSRLLQEMPIGTKTTNNANGDWFKWVLNKLYLIAQPLAIAFPELRPIVNPGNYSIAKQVLDVAGSTFKWLP